MEKREPPPGPNDSGQPSWSYEVPGGIVVLLIVATLGGVGVIAIAVSDTMKYSACVEHHSPADCK